MSCGVAQSNFYLDLTTDILFTVICDLEQERGSAGKKRSVVVSVVLAKQAGTSVTSLFSCRDIAQ